MSGTNLNLNLLNRVPPSGKSIPTQHTHYANDWKRDDTMFKVNDKVLCYHGPFLYEATVLFSLRPHCVSPLINPQVLEAENRTGKGSEGVGPHYKVHYKGWK